MKEQQIYYYQGKYPVVIIPKKNYKYITTQISSGRIIVKCLPETPKEYINSILEKSLPEIKKLFQNCKGGWLPYQYQDEETHYVFGQEYTLKVHTGTTNKIRLRAPYLELCCKENTFEYKDKIYKQWAKREVGKVVKRLTNKWAPRILEGLFSNTNIEIMVRKYKKIWGKCYKPKKKIGFNIDLIKLPKEIIEYVVVHELTHFWVSGHSAKFYDIVSKHLPNWQPLEEELNNYSCL